MKSNAIKNITHALATADGPQLLAIGEALTDLGHDLHGGTTYAGVEMVDGSVAHSLSTAGHQILDEVGA